MTGIDPLVDRIRAQMDLDSSTEHMVLAEIRDHLEEAVAADVVAIPASIAQVEAARAEALALVDEDEPGLVRLAGIGIAFRVPDQTCKPATVRPNPQRAVVALTEGEGDVVGKALSRAQVLEGAVCRISPGSRTLDCNPDSPSDITQKIANGASQTCLVNLALESLVAVGVDDASRSPDPDRASRVLMEGRHRLRRQTVGQQGGEATALQRDDAAVLQTNPGRSSDVLSTAVTMLVFSSGVLRRL